MASAVEYFRRLQPNLIDRAAHYLARGEGLRAMAIDGIVKFFNQLQTAVESGSPDWINPSLQDWVNSRPASVFVEETTSLPLLRAFKTATWDILRESLPKDEALEAILAVEPIFDHAWVYLSGLEAQVLLEQAALSLREVRSFFEKLDKSKSTFISVAAHELKTPLTLIEGYSTILTENAEDEQLEAVTPALTGINRGVLRLKELITDMLDLSQIDNGLLALNFQPVQLRLLIDQAHRKLREILEARQISFFVETAGRVETTTYADPERLFQALLHVIQNAVKFTPDSGTVTVRLRAMPGFIEIAVADTGIGIAPEEQERIFQPFTTLGDQALHSSSKTKFKGGGAGLGLPIARGILEAHGGSIWVESPGYNEKTLPGSTFHILIPHLTEPPKPNGNEANAAHSTNAQRSMPAGAAQKVELPQWINQPTPPLM
jgi:signal transduction histidine kinase